jgi:hypothetical protein
MTRSEGSALVKLRGDYSELDEELEGNDLEGVLVGRFEDDGAGCSGLLDRQPAGGTDAPPVSWLEAGEAVLGHGGGEIVAECLAGGEEGRIHDATDGVDAVVFGAGFAAASAVEAGHGIAAADVEGLAEDVFTAGFVGFGSGHGCLPLALVSHLYSDRARPAVFRDFEVMDGCCLQGVRESTACKTSMPCD